MGKTAEKALAEWAVRVITGPMEPLPAEARGLLVEAVWELEGDSYDRPAIAEALAAEVGWSDGLGTIEP